MKYLILLALLASCSPSEQKAPVSDNKEPDVITKPEEPVNKEPAPVTPTPVTPKPPTAIAYTEADLMKIVSESSCSKYGWGNRGKAPAGYIKSVVLTYATEVCNPNKFAAKTTKGTNMQDVAAWYPFEPSLEKVYALMLGSGMRESSGRQCTGVDTSASNYAANTAEAGLYQTSYNAFLNPSVPADVKLELQNIMAAYTADSKNCFSWNTCTTKNYGTGKGFEFQKLAKQCPAFSTKSHAILVRNLYRHYGPLINKAAELRTECVDMLTKVQAIVKPTCK